MAEDAISERANRSGKSRFAIDAIMNIDDLAKVPTSDECLKNVVDDGTEELRLLYNHSGWAKTIIGYGKVVKNFATLYFFREYKRKVEGKEKLKRRHLIEAIFQQEGTVQYKNHVLY